MNWLSVFYDMPGPLKVAFILGLISPAIVAASVLTGAIAPPEAGSFEYGAASNIVELAAAVFSSIPLVLSSALMLVRVRAALLLFVAGYISVCMGALFLPAVRLDLGYFFTSLAASLAALVVVFSYLFLARDVRRFFANSAH